MAITLIIVGAVVLAVSFVFLILNMIGSTRTGSDGMFSRHGLAMIGMFLGLIILFAGVIMYVWQLLPQLGLPFLQ